VQFLCKAIKGSALIEILLKLGAAETLIVEPHPVTGNLIVYRRITDDTMRRLGWIDVSGEYFEAVDDNSEYTIPQGWRRRS
jgi:hypothetical protein